MAGEYGSPLHRDDCHRPLRMNVSSSKCGRTQFAPTHGWENCAIGLGGRGRPNVRSSCNDGDVYFVHINNRF